ncbi:MAG: cysteine-rich CWC family protein [Chitinophagaceae bacterium]|nr:cysteine-rich CWC family protein [Chitinophagaceae bacterium]MBK8309991.1 cysteine-rich CWC family protein [Chitinophagaceae bacterium]MBK8607208.1 cysteine-rich CWC family protein [Chitinophagaceae bacterium]MBP6477487.1 cysteine-rich CWC family protein [Chitinophagaceae bacterium]MBP7108144.1 cysteine-rich CWC family protein [Chitinophagaceae bacterium]
MSLYEIKHCPKCKEHFECKFENITECQCYGIKLTDIQKAFIELHYNDCLCNNCLTTLQNDIELFKEK